MKNLFQDIPEALGVEIFETLVHDNSLKIERIVSMGQKTPEGDWLSSSQNEWVLLLKGSAKLSLEGKEALVELNPGDNLLIPAFLKHRVEWTDVNGPTLWLAVHY